jgi:hypothetical protein
MTRTPALNQPKVVPEGFKAGGHRNHEPAERGSAAWVYGLRRQSAATTALFGQARVWAYPRAFPLKAASRPTCRRSP